MINIELIAKLLTDKSSSIILFNIHDSHYVVTSELEISRAMHNKMLKGNKIVDGVPEKLKEFVENAEIYVDLFDYRKNYESDMLAFINEHKASFKIIREPEKLTFQKFVKFIKENNLYDDWISFFTKSISYDVYYWCLDTDQLEEEASEEQYKEIIRLVNEFELHNYELCIPDKFIFNIFDDYDPFSFVVLGNAGITHGINFALGYNSISFFKILQSENSSNVDLRVMNSLSNMVSFYTDIKDLEEERKNPYIKNPNISSVHIARGQFESNRLSASLANLCIKYLKKAIALLNNFIKSDNFSKIDLNKLLLINENLEVEDISEDNRVFLPIDSQNDYLEPLESGIKSNKIVDFKVCSPTGYIFDKNDLRIGYPSLMLLICNHQNGKVEKVILGEPDMYHPLSRFSIDIEREMKNYRIPKIIYVNNMFDEFFASCLYEKFIKNKTTKIYCVQERLFSDDAFEELDKELLKSFEQDVDFRA